MPTLKRIRGKYLMVLLAMCRLVSSSVGMMINTGGIFLSPIAAELIQPTATVNLTMTISNLAFAIACIFSAKWVKSKSYRLAVIGFTLFFAGSTALLAICRHMLSLYIFNALRGFAAGLIGNVLATFIIGQWFLADTGFITSLILGSPGLIVALVNPLFKAIIQSAGWRIAYPASGGMILLLNLPDMLFPISFLPEDSGMEPIGRHLFRSS